METTPSPDRQPQLPDPDEDKPVSEEGSAPSTPEWKPKVSDVQESPATEQVELDETRLESQPVDQNQDDSEPEEVEADSIPPREPQGSSPNTRKPVEEPSSQEEEEDGIPEDEPTTTNSVIASQTSKEVSKEEEETKVPNEESQEVRQKPSPGVIQAVRQHEPDKVRMETHDETDEYEVQRVEFWSKKKAGFVLTKTW